jgi:ABC-type phosphate transport system substrate-binding protein
MKGIRFALAVALFTTGCGNRGADTIILYGRENNSGTYMYFKEHVLEKADFAANVQTLPGTAAVINAVSRDPRSIGYGGIGYVKGVRTVPVKKDGRSAAVEPTLENVVNGSYPISRSLYFYTVRPLASLKALSATSSHGCSAMRGRRSVRRLAIIRYRRNVEAK